MNSEFELPGLTEVSDHGGAKLDRALRLELSAGERGIDVVWKRRLHEWRLQGGPVGVAIDHSPQRGYRFFVRDVGLFELLPDGSRAVSCPARSTGWYWRRYLTGQVLPFAALLQGLEVFHASAVELSGTAVAFMGPSGLGKSTIALNLHLSGAGFLTDDVLAVEPTDSGVIAHPGIAATKVRQRARDLIGPDPRGLLREPVSEDSFEVRYPLEPDAGPRPLGVVCLLEPAAEGTDVEVAEERADPYRLLGSTFNLLVQDPDRLRAQLDVCAEIARQARYLRVRVPPRPGPGTADRLAELLGGLA